MKKYILELIVFLCGAAVMILELVGSRIMAPYLGTSIVVWTSLIGIILGFLSLGYFLGGKLADKNPSYRIFSFVILNGAIFVGLIVFIQSFVLRFVQESIANIYFGTIVATLILFALPSAILGMVSPYAVRLKIDDVKTSGRTVGNLYAISTIGSIVGTFSAGFFLIPFFGSTKIIFFLSIGLVITASLAYLKYFFKVKIALVIFLISSFLVSLQLTEFKEELGYYDIDTQYSRVNIFKSTENYSNRPILILKTDPYAVQSGMFLDSEDDLDLVFNYSKFYRLGEIFNPGFKKSLLIGGAAYSYPKFYLKKYDNAYIDVVEIDAKLTDLARKHFRLKDDPRMRIYHQDGRIYLNKTKEKYDIIFMDAYNSQLSVPYQLTTQETVQEMYNILNNDGVVLANIISAIEGEKSQFLRAEYATYKSVFPQIYIFPVVDYNNGEKTQNILLVALKSKEEPNLNTDDQELNSYLGHLWLKPIAEDLPVLTDDYAPVDYYTMKMIEI